MRFAYDLKGIKTSDNRLNIIEDAIANGYVRLSEKLKRMRENNA